MCARALPLAFSCLVCPLEVSVLQRPSLPSRLWQLALPGRRKTHLLTPAVDGCLQSLACNCRDQMTQQAAATQAGTVASSTARQAVCPFPGCARVFKNTHALAIHKAKTASHQVQPATGREIPRPGVASAGANGAGASAVKKDPVLQHTSPVAREHADEPPSPAKKISAVLDAKIESSTIARRLASSPVLRDGGDNAGASACQSTGPVARHFPSLARATLAAPRRACFGSTRATDLCVCVRAGHWPQGILAETPQDSANAPCKIFMPAGC